MYAKHCPEGDAALQERGRLLLQYIMSRCRTSSESDLRPQQSAEHLEMSSHVCGDHHECLGALGLLLSLPSAGAPACAEST